MTLHESRRTLAVRFFWALAFALLAALACPASAGDMLAPRQHAFEFRGVVDDATPDLFRDELKKALEEHASEVVVRISSPGGSVFSGMEVLSILRSSPLPTRCVVDGIAASMAAVILQACTVRAIEPYSLVLFHEARSSSATPMRAGDMATEGRTLAAINRAVALFVSKRLGLGVQAYEAQVAGGDWWLSSDQALAANAVDEVLP